MAGDDPRITAQSLKILAVLMSHAEEEISGADIARTTKLLSGTLYPILLRFETAGWVKSRWESGNPRVLGRPRRRLYRITPLGARKTKAAIQDVLTPLKEFAWL
jgi:PadR family transcriptional regulator, regulatory protein PadR